MHRLSQYQQADPDLVESARSGDQRALDELLTAYLPLLYNVVGRALEGHADVDDVVQETLVRAVEHLGELRDPAAFRAWLLAIAMRQIRDSRRRRQSFRSSHQVALDDVQGVADPTADFVDLTILQLGLSGQRQDVALATRWLDPDQRELLSLWWLEAAGHLERAELAQATGTPSDQISVRVQRMKAQLEDSRLIVVALSAKDRCAALDATAAGWNGRPSALWRKRFARHIDGCARCSRFANEMVPAERLLSHFALLAVPAALALRPPVSSWAHLVAPASPSRATRTATSSAKTAHSQARAHWILGHVCGKVLAALVVVAVGASAAVAYTARLANLQKGDATSLSLPGSPPSVTSPLLSTAPPRPTASPAHHQRPSRTARSARNTPHPSTPAVPPRFVYGQTVDAVDTAPADPMKPPAALPRRPEGKTISVSADSRWSPWFSGALGGKWELFYNGDFVTLRGEGYLTVRWEVAYFNRTPGQLAMPTWTGLDGKLFHVASGGSRRMTDEVPGTTDAPHTWMGRPALGYDRLPRGAQQMWQTEFYYLDGSVTLHENENFADYNVSVTPATWRSVDADINTKPSANRSPSDGIVRYGIVRDTGNDAAPVPQYLTRKTPADPLEVAQKSSGLR